MAVSSLLFGGHSLWQAKSATTSSLDVDSLPANVSQGVWEQFGDLLRWFHLLSYQAALYVHSIDPRTYAWLISTLCLLVLLAYSTNPSDSSFRSYLTELSLHQHLRKLHRENVSDHATSSEDELEGATRSEAEKSTTPHILTFANRISVSLRTPRYDRRDYMIFCTVDVQSSLSARHVQQSRQAGRACYTRYVGAFGKWWMSGTVWTASGEKASAGKSSSQQADSWGVYKMRTGENVEEGENAILHEKDTDRQSSPSGSSAKLPATTKVAESSQTRPTARRKKQAQKSRAALSPAASEGHVAERKGSDDMTAASSVMPTFPNDNLEKSQIPESPSPIATSSQANAAEASSGNASALAEYQSQLEQIRQASETSRTQLQTQLEELRSRKRDEDAARIDVKGKVKTLDESKRHAEGVKREAERRLKAANNLKEAIENRIEGRAKEIEALRSREVAHRQKVADRSERKVATIADLKAETQRKEEEKVALDEELVSLNDKLERLRARMLEEEANLEAAQELAAERDNAAAAANAQREYASPNSRYLNMYPLLSGPGDMGDTSASESFSSDWSGNHGQGQTYGPHSAQGMHHSRSPMGTDRMRGSEMDFDETFDPTRATAPPSSHSDHTHPTFAPFSFEQNTFQRQMAAAAASQDPMQRPYTPPTDALSMPPTPFTSDLLPSNLFQNADDDERHIGVLPGTRAEHVEAALNRFGLDSSDTSDLGDMDEGSVRGLEEGTMLSSKQGNRKEGQEDEGETQSTSEDRPRRLSRSWWGGRSRNSSKEQSGASISNNLAMTPSSSVDNRLPVAVSSSEAMLDSTQPAAEPTKRRSMSIFPKLSLNPGAKSFRGMSKRSDADSRALQSALAMEDPMMQVMWNNSTGRLPTGQDFESMKRAFQTNNLQAEEEEDEQGRRSWSAFDTWQQQQQQQQQHQQHGMHSQGSSLSSFHAPSVTRQRGRFPSHLGWGSGNNYRSSSDSITASNRAFLADQGGAVGMTPPSTASPSRSDWLDDVILPLHKSHSIEAPPSSVSSSSLPRSLRGSGKASRFAFWNSSSGSTANSSGNNGPIAEASGTATPSSPSVSAAAALEEGAIAIPGSSNNKQSSRGSSPAAPLLSSSTSPPAGTPQQPTKRTSFRWSRRQETSSNDGPLALSSMDKVEKS